MAYGNGRFVAVGAVGSIQVSTDATNWVTRTTPVSDTFESVACGNGRFVVVGGTVLVTSPDTTNWVSAPSGTTNALHRVTYGNGLFVAVGDNQTIVTSPDGTTWTKRREIFGDWLRGVAAGNGSFMAVANGSGAALTSPDGIIWTARPAFGSGFRNVIFGNGVFVAENLHYVAAQLVPRIITSTDGSAWAMSTLLPSSAAYLHDGTRFVLVDSVNGFQSNVVYTSSNGLNWTTTNFIAPLPNSHLKGLAFGGGQYVGVSGAIVYSSDLLQWPAVGSALPISAARVFLRVNNQRIIAGTGPILVSTNGVDYQTNATTGSFGAGAFGAGMFVLTTGGGAIVTSPDAATWTARNTGGSSINGLTYGNNLFVAVGNAGDIRTSPTGTSWSGRFSGTTLNLNAVATGNGMFVAVGAGGAILTSSDAASWTLQDSGTASMLRCVAFGNGVFFAAGDGGVIRTSSDGVNWSVVDGHTSANFSAAAATRGNLLLASSTQIVGELPALLSSLDGLHWRHRHAPLAGSVVSIGVSDKTFLLLGLSAAILESGELSPIGIYFPGYHHGTGFVLRATGDAGTASRLQCSTNLVNWTDVLTFTNTGAPIPTWDNAATNLPYRFYRVFSP